LAARARAPWLGCGPPRPNERSALWGESTRPPRALTAVRGDRQPVDLDRRRRLDVVHRRLDAALWADGREAGESGEVAAEDGMGGEG
jgi:hypothetical protein